jgi:hypothetical protein
MMPKAAPGFASEAALCAAFIECVMADGEWTAYAETAGWDILLVRSEDGLQIGIEAKMALNTKVVCQALPESWYSYGVTGPDCRAVLVPYGTVQNGLTTICRHLGITVVTLRPADGGADTYYRRRPRDRINPNLPNASAQHWGGEEWHEWCPVTRVKLPAYVPDVAAGASAPLRLTDWKIKAIKLLLILEQRPVTRLDFKALSLDPRRWTDYWLRSTPDGYVVCDGTPDLKRQHPVVYEQIRAEMDKWYIGDIKRSPQTSLFASTKEGRVDGHTAEPTPGAA